VEPVVRQPIVDPGLADSPKMTILGCKSSFAEIGNDFVVPLREPGLGRGAPSIAGAKQVGQ